jgi:hypothetical protein
METAMELEIEIWRMLQYNAVLRIMECRIFMGSHSK